MRLTSILLICAVVALSACTPNVAVRPGAPLRIVHTRYIPVAPELLMPCTAPSTTLHTWGDLAQAYISLHAAYLTCAAQIQAIAITQSPSPTPSRLIPGASP